MRQIIDRRTILRGIGTAIPLPFLDAMLPSSAKAAASTNDSVPPRMVVCHYGTGTNVDEFFPKTFGKDFAASRILKPIDKFRDDMTIISGLYLEHGGGHRGDYTFLTGTRGARGDGIETGISADQVVADSIGSKTRYPSLQLSISEGTGFGGGGLATLSWNRSGIPMAAENDVKTIFSRLFKVDNRHEARVKANQRRKHGSILDAVSGQARQLGPQLSSNDKEKLDEYFTSLREIERQIQRDEDWIDRPKPVPSLNDIGDYSRPYHPRVAGFEYDVWKNLMFDLIIMALQTDSTRVISFNIRQEATPENWPVHRVSKGHHGLTHFSGPNDLSELAQVDEINMTFWARFLERISSIKEADGRSLLDHTMVAHSSGAGMNHSRDKLPTFLIGGSALGVKHQGHLKLPADTPLSRVWHTMADRMGVDVGNEFQDSRGRISELIK